MSEMREPSAGGARPDSTGNAGALDYGRPVQAYGLGDGSSSTLRLGGLLGIAACSIGLLILVAACAGLNRVVVLSIIPVGLSLPGLILTLVGAIRDKNLIAEDTHVLQALFVNFMGLIGGFLEMAAWLHWPVFNK